MVGSPRPARSCSSETPQALAISAFGPCDAPVRISYHAYAHLVERFSGALYELGVRPGHVVAIQLPNWWQALVLFQAVARLGAVLAPCMTTIRPREIVFTVQEFGFERQETLQLAKREVTP